MNQTDMIELVISESKKLENILRSKFLKIFGRLHNIEDKYNKFDIKQEVVAKTSLFLDIKKSYVMYIVNQEGIPKEEYNIRGIEIRRSDYPSLTKIKLQEFLDFVVKDNDNLNFAKVRTFINDTRDQIEDLCINGSKNIAKPVSYSGAFDDYKVVPSHIHGMELWNSLEYKYFVPGTKGYLFTIMGIDINTAPKKIIDNLHKFTKKNTNIVLPPEEDKLPEYYIPDVEHMLDFAWNDRIERLISPIKNYIEINNINETYGF